MIQFNLLPDIKLEYIKAKRAKRSVLLISAAASGLTVGIFILLLLTVNVFQKKYMSDLTKDIEQQKTELDKINDLDKILTVQNQLNSLTGLHEQKPATTRLFDYLPRLVPQNASISSLSLDYGNSSIKISGSADAISTINKFVDTLKFTQYKLDETESPAFTNVVLSDFGRSDQASSYSISLNFDPTIFDSTKKPKLTVPSIISTRSETEKPSENLFQPQPETGEGVAQ